MKKIALLVAAALALITVHSQAQQVQLNLEGAQLLTSGSTAMANNMLVELIEDTTTTFGAPTPTSFVGTDPNEAVLWSGTVSSGQSGVAGGFGPVQITLSGASLTTGDYLLLRWFPTLSLSASSPGANTTYGQFRTNAVENGSDIAWQVPAASADPYQLNFLTVSEGGTEPNSAGVANLTVTSVPEPASLSLIAGAFSVGALALRRRKTGSV